MDAKGANLTWHEVGDPRDPKLDELAAQYGLHPLHIEDCRHRNQRAKAEQTPDYLFVVLKPARMEDRDEPDFADLDVFVGRDFCITVSDPEKPFTSDALARARKAGTSERPDRILYLVFDAIADSYLTAIDQFDECIDRMEDRVLHDPSPSVLEYIFSLKRGLAGLRRVLVNSRDVCSHLQRDAASLIGEDLAPFFRDVYDHIARDLDLVETLRDLLTNTMDVYLSSVANRTNEVMKVLTVLSTVALPAVVISGIYGMNVKGIPFIDSPHSIWIISAMMAGTTAGLLILLRRFRWL